MRKFTFFNGFEKSWDGISIDTIREVVYQYMGRQNRNVVNLDHLSLYREIQRSYNILPDRDLRAMYFGGIDPVDPLNENDRPIIFTATQVQR